MALSSRTNSNVVFQLRRAKSEASMISNKNQSRQQQHPSKTNVAAPKKKSNSAGQQQTNKPKSSKHILVTKIFCISLSLLLIYFIYLISPLLLYSISHTIVSSTFQLEFGLFVFHPFLFHLFGFTLFLRTYVIYTVDSFHFISPIYRCPHFVR